MLKWSLFYFLKSFVWEHMNSMWTYKLNSSAGAAVSNYTTVSPWNPNLIKIVALPNTLCPFYFLKLYIHHLQIPTTENEKSIQQSRLIPDHNSTHRPFTSLVTSSEWCEPFRLDSINKCLTDLRGAPFPDSSARIKDKWRIIDSQLSAKGISMTELLGSLPLSLLQSRPVLLFPYLSPCLTASPLTPPRTMMSINVQQWGKNLLNTSIAAMRIQWEVCDLICCGKPRF